MPVLKLNTRPQQAQDGAPRTGPSSARAAPSPTPSTGGGSVTKLKLKNSQPPTPATEQLGFALGAAGGVDKKKKPAAPRKPTNGSTGRGGGGKKRAANDDLAPAPKRLASGPQAARGPSLKIKPPATLQNGYETVTPLTAGGLNKLKIGGPRKQVEVKRTTLIARRKVPDRPKGVGYDSEDSEREEDPAIQQGLVLRMKPGDDADLLRNAIANGKIGLPIQEHGLDVSLKFMTNDLRRAVVKIKGRMYAAALVDLPCIVESMKSWDKKGWWKVADICQMLLVLGRVQTEDEVKNYALPREVDKETMQYAHGLTPPMHYVRKRRFRKRVSYRQMENVEEEVERLLREDDEWERHNGASIKVQEYNHAEWDRMQNEPEEDQQYDDEMDADGELMETTEAYDQQPEYYEEPEQEVDTSALEAELGDAFAQDAFEEPAPLVGDLITDSPLPLPDQAASFAAVENAMAEDSAAETPAATPAQATQDEQSSDEDESDYDDDDDDSLDVVDEDAAAKAAERAQQLEEVADLEREIANVREKTSNMTNQLLRRREEAKLGKLEDDLKMKRSAFGLDAED